MTYYVSALYRFHDGRDTLDYLASTYVETGPARSRVDYVYTIWTLGKDGLSIQARDRAGIPWQLMRSTFPNDSTRVDTLSRQHWIEMPELDAR